jgi:hypothetical protein
MTMMAMKEMREGEVKVTASHGKSPFCSLISLRVLCFLFRLTSSEARADSILTHSDYRLVNISA